MKITKTAFFSLLTLLVACLTGCGGPILGSGSAPQATLQTRYGSGYQNFGSSSIDPGVLLHVLNDDPGCTSGGINLADKNTDMNGNLLFAPNCSPELIQVLRYPSANCKIVNSNDPTGQPDYIYAGFDVSGGDPTPHHLDCGAVTADVVLTPTSMDSFVPVGEVQMSGPPGTFSMADGYPQIFFTDETGNVDGSVSADSVAPDGSWITFATEPLLTAQNTVPPGNYVLAAMNQMYFGPMVDPAVGLFRPVFPTITLIPAATAVLSVTSTLNIRPGPIAPPCPIYPILPTQPVTQALTAVNGVSMMRPICYPGQ